ncbi:uncharacterized protein LOC141907642 [Tubulanus polymorphus]|uniref:uncharacterized protein LOC141907642 n=1 Tax=Tubulanus polymorphus TaxID=672921 RepID=UPI003DA63D42
MSHFTAVKLSGFEVNIVSLIVWILIVDISSVTGYNGSVCTAFCSKMDSDYGGHWFDVEYCTGGEFCCGGKGITSYIKYCCTREGYRIPENENRSTTTTKSSCENTKFVKIFVPVIVVALLMGCLIGGLKFWCKKRHQAMNQVSGPASSTLVYGGAPAHNAYSGPQNNAPYPPANAPPPPTNYYGGPPNNAPYPPAGAPPPPMNYNVPPPSYDSAVKH